MIALTALGLFGTVVLATMVHAAFFGKSTSGPFSGRTTVALCFGLVLVLASLWSGLVNQFVPEPYLDEIFHVPQAQTYCDNRWFDWDDKITTPPGLYIVSRAFNVLKPWFVEDGCSVARLRQDNVAAVACVFILAVLCRQKIENRMLRDDQRKPPSTFAIQTGLNVAFFPVLFFFSGLYYTDVFSTLFVLLAYDNHLSRVAEPRSSSVLSDLWTVVLGVAALFFRQTNVFWVVVYMGGLEAIHAVKSLRPVSSVKPQTGPQSFGQWGEVFVQRAAAGDVHDIPLHLAWSHDVVACVLSICLAALYNPLRIARQIWPHIVVVGLFTGFIFWNGGVVLGDKLNHVATIHLPQMLYIWPLFAFFSAPLFVPTLLRPIRSILDSDSADDEPGSEEDLKPGKSDNKQQTAEDASDSPRSLPIPLPPQIYCVPLILSTVVTTWVVLNLNTIVHPFTLADNRHYMFYVFRYTIRRSVTFRDSLAPVYVFCGWLCWSMLSHVPSTDNQSQKTKRGLSATVPTSTVLLWILATALSLVTAPLVEPRYFILPWVFWRLLVPVRGAGGEDSSSVGEKKKDASKSSGRPAAAEIESEPCSFDTLGMLETLWYVAINAATMAVFLLKPFEWASEEGKLQRFMW